MRKSFRACSVLLAAGPALATDITLADLPAQLRECSGPGCHLSLHSAVDIGSMSAFAMFSGGQQSWVLRYTVSPGSSDSVGEHLWLQMQAHYDLTEELHPVTLYMNEVDAGWRWSDAGQAPQFSMTTDALLASSASGEVQFLGPPSGNLRPGGPPPAATPGFSSGATLNLLYLYFADDGGSADLQFNAAETRTLLFSQFDRGFDQGVLLTSTTSYFAAPVPLPAAWVLLTSSAALLGAMRRRVAPFPRAA